MESQRAHVARLHADRIDIRNDGINSSFPAIIRTVWRRVLLLENLASSSQVSRVGYVSEIRGCLNSLQSLVGGEIGPDHQSA